MSCRTLAQFFAADDGDDEVFDQMVPDTVLGRVLPPTSPSYRYSHRVSLLQCLV